jgi:hypothetical protein
MKSNIVIVPFLFSFTFAQPHRHQHQNLHAKRDTVWVTDVEWVTTTVDVTTTMWIDPNSTPPPAPAEPTSTQDPPAEFHETIASSSSAVYVVPSSNPILIPTPTVAPAPYVAPTIDVNPAPSSSTTPVAAPSQAPVAPVAVATPSASPQAGPQSSGYSGECSVSSPCTGKFTYYDTSTSVTGACGWGNDGLTEAVVALPAGFMGPQSNGNPFCDKTITLSVGTTTINATVVDKCPGCSGYAVDLSRMAFGELCDLSLGHIEGTWWIN